MQLIIISPPEMLPNEILLVNKLFKIGMKNFHLRKPSLSRAAVSDYLKQIESAFLNQIILHNYFDLVNEFGLKGIHLNSFEKQNAAHFFQNKTQHISCSCHSFEEIKNETLPYNYYFISPIFDSISKPGYKSNFNLAELKNFIIETEKNIVAMGGIDETNIAEVKQTGCYGAAVLGGLWQAENIAEQFSSLSSAMLNAKKVKNGE